MTDAPFPVWKRQQAGASVLLGLCYWHLHQAPVMKWVNGCTRNNTALCILLGFWPKSSPSSQLFITEWPAAFRPRTTPERRQFFLVLVCRSGEPGSGTWSPSPDSLYGRKERKRIVETQLICNSCATHISKRHVEIRAGARTWLKLAIQLARDRFALHAVWVRVRLWEFSALSPTFGISFHLARNSGKCL